MKGSVEIDPVVLCRESHSIEKVVKEKVNE